MQISGLHHVTAIAADPQRNLNFYAGLLGLRLVKRTVNFDDPGSYHFYFGDRSGSPGTILTFFPWPHAVRGRSGSGETESTAFSVPKSSIHWWRNRLKERGIAVEDEEVRFGQEVLRFSDPDGMRLEFVGTDAPASVSTYGGGSVPVEHSIRGFHGVTLVVDAPEATAELLTVVFGYRRVGAEGARRRFVSADSGALGAAVDLVAAPGAPRGRLGAGSVHHVAFRVSDEQGQVALRDRLGTRGLGVSPVMDRTYFRSIYFREPNGVLFEIATDGPGFSIDEPAAELGTSLRLPRWMESSRSRIEAVLPPIQLPNEP